MSHAQGGRGIYLKAFLISSLTAAVTLLPFVISGRGILYVFDDYNLQQIPFNMLCNSSIKSGDIFWSWNTDLGSSFPGAYAFYTLGSPFFWISLIFPASFFPYLSAPLLVLKFAAASLTSFVFIRLFVKSDGYALLGSLLYAFSGFQIGNIFYNHFLDVTALFPLLLIAAELMFTQGGFPGFFALAVALNALTNYEFFVGEIVFLLIYFLCRVFSKEIRLTPKKFAALVAESLMGMGLACFLLVPAVLFTLCLPRAGRRMDAGTLGALIYDPGRYLGLLKAALLPAEAVDRSVIAPLDWSSTEAYLPVFGTVPVFAYIISRGRKPDWLTVSIGVCAVFAAVPLLNSAFYLFNAQYYSRWFYMPILLCALACARALEQGVRLRRGAAATAAAWAVFCAGLALENTHRPAIISQGRLLFMLIHTALGFAAFFGASFIRDKKIFVRVMAASVCVFAAASGIYTISSDRKNYPAPDIFTSVYLKAGEGLSLPAGGDYRIDTTDAYRNTNIILGLPSIDNFSSTVDGSITEFYASLGIDRVNNSQPDFSLAALRPFLSVKYYLLPRRPGLKSLGYHGRAPSESAPLCGAGGEYELRENTDFIPFGYTFDSCISSAEFEKTPFERRPGLLLRALVLNPEQMKKYSPGLRTVTACETADIAIGSVKADAAARRKECGSGFKRDNNGFETEITLSRDNLVFFSVPYDSGWSAWVNGSPAKIEKVDSGFMAVPCSAGDNRIVFRFRPAGMYAGAAATAVSAAALIAYMLAARRKRKKSI